MENTELYNELMTCKATGELSELLKKMYMELVWEMSASNRYAFLNQKDRSRCEAKAYNDLCDHGLHYNPKVSKFPISYMETIIISSFTIVISKVRGNYAHLTVEGE